MARIAELEIEGSRGAEALVAATARIAQIEAAREEAERGRKDAHVQADQAIADRDELRLMLEAAKRSIQDMNAAVDAGIAELEGERRGSAGALAVARARIAELEIEGPRGAEALAAATHRIAQIEAAREEAERGWNDADAQAEQAIADRDELRLMLDAAKRSIQGMNAAVDERLAAIDAKRARALQAAEERAAAAFRERDALIGERDALIGERDALAVQLAAPPPTDAVKDEDARQQLEAATERIHTLELQLFARDRGPHDRDVDLGSLLRPTPPASIDRSGPPATRYGFKPPKKVKIDGKGGLLVDLSVSGAQVICATAPEVGRVVTLTLLSDEAPCFCQGRILWARREQSGKGRPYRYPAGIAFTEIDDAAIRAFIARHAPDQA